MKSENPPALAAAADVLGDQLRAHLRRLAKLLRPHVAGLEKQFLARLKRLRLDPRQKKALAAIVPGAAAEILAGRRPPPAFFEQVEYNGRRLAKLNLPPSKILEALRIYGRLLRPVLRSLPALESANLQWALEQLQFSVILTLNNAFYQVREAETQAYHDLFHADLEAQNLDDLLVRFLETLSRFCHAEAGAFFLFDGKTSSWRFRAATEKSRRTPVRELVVPASRARVRRLSVPRCAIRKSDLKLLTLDPRWRRRFHTCWSIPLAEGGRLPGVMQFGFSTTYEWLPREVELLAAAAERCLRAAEKARLVEHLGAREEQVRRLAENMLQVEERERRRISSELHDEAGQSLLCIRLQLEMLERTAPEAMTELRGGLQDARALTERTIVEIRRLIAALSPAVLEELGLAAALRQLVSRFRRLYPGRVRLHVSSLERLPKKLEIVAYRLVQECLNNVARHSFASKVNIWVVSDDESLKVRVEDDGVGFDVEEALAKRDSFGLAGMRERVALFGGKFHLQSRPKRGAKIIIELPLRETGRR